MGDLLKVSSGAYSEDKILARQELVLVIEDNCLPWMHIGDNGLDSVWVGCYTLTFCLLLIPTQLPTTTTMEST